MPINYAKISRFDYAGNDNSLSLQELTSFKILYTDIGTITYTVLEISEFPTYYLYKLVYSYPTSSTNYNIEDYHFVGVTSSFNGVGTGRVNITPTIDTQGAFNQLADKYTFPNSPPIYLRALFTSSINTLASALSTSIALTTQYAGELEEIDLQTSSFAPGISSSVSFNYTGSFNTGQALYVTYRSTDGFALNNTTFTLTQSIASNSMLNQVILEPYITSPFYNSDNNVLVNNIFLNSRNDKFMDVDYSTDITHPVNLIQILSGTATRAEVKPYYYSLLRHIRPRYIGSKNQSAYLNFYSSPTASFVFVDGDTGSYAGDIGNGNKPNIYLLNSNIVEYKWGKNSEPEVPGCSDFEFGKIIEVYSATHETASVNILTANSENFTKYHFAISSSFFPNYDGYNFIQYGTNIPVNYFKVVTTDFGVPAISTYWIPTNVSVSGSFNTYSAWSSTFNAFQFGLMRKVVNGGKEGVKEYVVGDVVGNILTTAPEFNEITQSIINGDTWMMTISSRINSPLTESIIPWNYGYTDKPPHEYRLESLGVYQIVSASGPLPQLLYFKNPLLDTNGNAITASLVVFGPGQGIDSGGLGALLWKAVAPKPPTFKPTSRYLIMEGVTQGKLDKGAIILPNSTFDINQHFNYILKNFGEK